LLTKLLIRREAQQFAEHADPHKNNITAAIADIFRRLTSRRIADKEMKLVQSLYDDQLIHFRKHPDKAAALLKVGDMPADKTLPKENLAAMTVVANTLMNYHECVMRQ